MWSTWSFHSKVIRVRGLKPVKKDYDIASMQPEIDLLFWLNNKDLGHRWEETCWEIWVWETMDQRVNVIGTNIGLYHFTFGMYLQCLCNQTSLDISCYWNCEHWILQLNYWNTKNSSLIDQGEWLLSFGLCDYVLHYFNYRRCPKNVYTF